jgi:hypothetical protein
LSLLNLWLIYDSVAGERERILTDLRLLQKRNAQLIDENQQSIGNYSTNFAAMREQVEEGATASPVTQKAATRNEAVGLDNFIII